MNITSFMVFLGWQRFDNAYVHQPLKDGYFAWLPVTSVRDLREYLVWSLSGAVELADVKVTIAAILA